MLTLGPNVIVNQAINETAGYAQLTSAGSNHTGDGIVNEGTINAEAVNGTFYIEPYNFTNAGTINVANGDKLYIEPNLREQRHNCISGGTVVSRLTAGTTHQRGTLELAASSAQTVTFMGPTGTLELQHSLTAPFTGSISGLASGLTDVIDLADSRIPNRTADIIMRRPRSRP